MDRDQLSPQLGRLIDQAKVAALRAAGELRRPEAEAWAGTGSGARRAEGMALLLADGTVQSAPSTEDEAQRPDAAAGLAARADGVEILAAAVAVTDDAAPTLNPSPQTRRILAQIDPDLPLVVKQHGRWVMVPLSGLPPFAGELRVERVHHPGHDLLVTLEAYDLEAFGPTGLRTYDLAVMAQAGAVFLARLGDEIVAGSQLLRMLDEPAFFYVVGFYVRPEWQRLGVGKAFLEAVAGEARKLGAEGLILAVSPQNTAALSLYESAGFANERFVPHFYGEGEDRYILRWRFVQGDLQGSV
jgi:N-alpha-acetyltransferase 50